MNNEDKVIIQFENNTNTLKNQCIILQNEIDDNRKEYLIRIKNDCN